MASTVLTSAIIGLDGHRVDVECDVAPGLPGFSIVGLPDAAVQEARERVKSAMRHADLPYPRTKITINLAPADLRKNGTGFDLPIAIAVLTTLGDLPAQDQAKRLFIGELALDGKLRSVTGALSTSLLAKQLGIKELILPIANAPEAALVPDIQVFGASDLKSVVSHLLGASQLPLTPTRQEPFITPTVTDSDLLAVRGQEQAKRALEIAAAGGHNILLHGPPGSGKTLLARSFPSILPSLTYDEALEITRIHSVAGLLPREGLISERPYRAPHHTASGAALVGGGSTPRPGEISLAHRGVLFLDEFPEFSRPVLENLRQPLEDGHVTVSRAHGTVIFPARFMLVAAMNPCPCGYATDPDRSCQCTPVQVSMYRKRLSGPLLDRIDLMIDVPHVPTDRLMDLLPGEPSTAIRERVQKARDAQIARYRSLGLFTNAELSSDQVRRLIHPTESARSLLRQAVDRFRLSARSYFRVLKVAQTISDLADSKVIDQVHLAEAMRYRQTLES